MRHLIKRLVPASSRLYGTAHAAARAWDIGSRRLYEPEIDLIALNVRPGDTAIDIGANVGAYAFHLSRAVGPSGRVIAFEPIPETAREFRMVARWLRFGGNTTLHERGCSDENAEKTFVLPVQATGAVTSTVAFMLDRGDTVYASTREVACKVIRIDDFVGSVGNVSFIKSDIEGADLLALRGARKTIEQNRPVIVTEYNDGYIRRFGLTVEEFIGFFTGVGYRLHRYERPYLVPVTPEHMSQPIECNLVALPTERRFDNVRSSAS